MEQAFPFSQFAQASAEPVTPLVWSALLAELAGARNSVGGVSSEDVDGAQSSGDRAPFSASFHPATSQSLTNCQQS